MTVPAGRDLARWIAEQRWYAGQPDGPMPTVVKTHVVDLPGLDDLVVGLAGMGGVRYQLLIRPHQEDRTHPDVADDLDALAQLGTVLARAEPGHPASSGWIQATWLDDPFGDEEPRLLATEQSNTSAVLGGSHVLKLYRRVAAGRHPEVEIARHLDRRTHAGDAVPVPPLAGWYEFHDPATADEPTALGIVHRLVEDARSGWDVALDDLATDPAGLLIRLHDLGTSLATLHHSLAAPGEATGTGPDPFGRPPLPPDAVRTLVDGVGRDARARLDRPDDGPATDLLAELAGRGTDVAAVADDLAERLGDDLGAAIRTHGDLHLGQVLVAADGWRFIDFEGEPSRSLADRRRRQSPLRDVAGMLRSLAYVTDTAERAGTRVEPGWEPAARAALLDGYLTAVDPDLLPPSAADVGRLLTLLEVEKLVYEVGYELDHRPGWVDLPAGRLRTVLIESGRW